ncbi:MAG: carbon monoxide dehydrogenase [Candidatus Omnitrophica bacterium]|nr:carbon monoxide dehydrogenase [Candidatus Omnitrophota bacterium]
MIAALASKDAGSILAIDADPNSCLADALGVSNIQTIVGICDEISKNIDKIPAGMTKDRYIEMRIQEAVAEEEGFDLLVMGRPEGPGCYCYVNSLLRAIIERVTKNYNFVVIDNAAGMEHISRRTAGGVDKLILVSDYSVAGVLSAKKIYELAKSLKIKIGSSGLIVNKVSGPMLAIDKEVKATALELLGAIPYDDAVVDWGISGKSVFELKSKALSDAMKKIMYKLT